MPISPQLKTVVEDQLAPFGAVRICAMFGGAGVYLDALMIAVLDDETVYLKADAETEADFIAAGCAQFTYDAKGKPMTMGYWSCPEGCFDEPDMMGFWVDKARASALQAKAKRTPKRRQD